MDLSPKQITDQWIAKQDAEGNTTALVNLLDHLIGHSIEAAVLAYQWIRVADCEHPGLFARPGDQLTDTRQCSTCGQAVPVAEL